MLHLPAALVASALCTSAIAQTLIATHSNYGAGCGTECHDSFVQSFSPSSLDLANTSAFTMLPTGSGYIVVPGAALFVPPTGAATILALGDDAETTVSLSVPFPSACDGILVQLTVCSNGIISTGAGSTIAGTPDETVMLTNPTTAWWSWHDYDPSLAGSGKVKFEEVGGIAYLTWDGVWDAGGTSVASANTVQFQFDLTTGEVALVYGSMSLAGNGHVVGYSRGGAALGACVLDISSLGFVELCCASTGVTPLQLDMLSPPKVGTTPVFRTSNIPACALFLMVGYGLAPFPSPGLPLSPLFPGCFLHHDLVLNWGPVVFFPTTSFVDQTFVLLDPVPNIIGLDVYAQSMCWVGGLQTGITSNGVHMVIGDR